MRPDVRTVNIDMSQVFDRRRPRPRPGRSARRVACPSVAATVERRWADADSADGFGRRLPRRSSIGSRGAAPGDLERDRLAGLGCTIFTNAEVARPALPSTARIPSPAEARRAAGLPGRPCRRSAGRADTRSRSRVRAASARAQYARLALVDDQRERRVRRRRRRARAVRSCRHRSGRRGSRASRASSVGVGCPRPRRSVAVAQARRARRWNPARCRRRPA